MSLDDFIIPIGLLLGLVLGGYPMSLHVRERLSLGRHTAHKLMGLQVLFAAIAFIASIIISDWLEPPRWNINEASWTAIQIRTHRIELAIISLWVVFPIAYIASYIFGLPTITTGKSAKVYRILWPLLGIVFLCAWLFANLVYGCAVHDSCP